ncbi:MAG: CBS domain-containing protein [Oscillospiraceae bacterium]|nr:CBS domain-containing protein [Oscillospiraceae bacterium]
MKVRELMSSPAVSIGVGETVETAARTLTHYNIGALPVCGSDGSLQGMITDRDLVIRCVAANRSPEKTQVAHIMSGGVQYATPDMDASVAAHLMGRCQIRRLPVLENGKLCGMLTLGDLAAYEQSIMDAADALSDISANITYG